MPKVRELELGTRFQYPESGKTATLISLGQVGARIKFDNENRHVEINTELAEADFVAPGRPVLVSDGSDVIVLGSSPEESVQE
jgi:hypothetical protein